MSEVSLERAKFPLQDYIHNLEIFFCAISQFSYNWSHLVIIVIFDYMFQNTVHVGN